MSEKLSEWKILEWDEKPQTNKQLETSAGTCRETSGQLRPLVIYLVYQKRNSPCGKCKSRVKDRWNMLLLFVSVSCRNLTHMHLKSYFYRRGFLGEAYVSWISSDGKKIAMINVQHLSHVLTKSVRPSKNCKMTLRGVQDQKPPVDHPQKQIGPVVTEA